MIYYKGQRYSVSPKYIGQFVQTKQIDKSTGWFSFPKLVKIIFPFLVVWVLTFIVENHKIKVTIEVDMVCGAV